MKRSNLTVHSSARKRTRHSEHTLRLARTFARVVLCRHDVLVPDDLLGRVKRHQVELLNLGNSALVAGNLWESKDTEAEEPSQLGCFHTSQGNSKTAAQSSVHLIHIFFLVFIFVFFKLDRLKCDQVVHFCC